MRSTNRALPALLLAPLAAAGQVTAERLVSLDKTGLREYTIGTESAHPPYGEIFDDQEIADLLAWLLSLKGL